MSSKIQEYARAASLEGFRDFVLSYKCDPDKILTLFNIEPSILDSPESLIAISDYRRVLNEAARVTKEPRFGLLLSQRQTLEKLGPVGYLIRHAPTLEDSLDELTRFLKTHSSGINIYLERYQDLVNLSLQLTGLNDESTVQQCELALGLMTKFLRTVVTENWCAETIYFEHSSPDDLSDFQRIFRCPVKFEKPLTAIVFPSKYLKFQLKTADPGLYKVLRDYLGIIDKKRGNDFIDQVRKVIHHQIEQSKPRIESTASALGLTRHKLQQKLKQKGTHYQALLEKERMGLAQHYLKDTDLSLVEISSILGLSEPAVLTRLFNRNTGTSPSVWRKTHKESNCKGIG